MVVICYIWYSMVILWLLLSIYFLLNEGKPFNQPTSRKRTSPQDFIRSCRTLACRPTVHVHGLQPVPKSAAGRKIHQGWDWNSHLKICGEKHGCLKMNFHGRFSVYPVFMSYVLHLVHGCHRENDDKPPDFVGCPLYFSRKPICSKHTLPVKMMWSPCQPQSPSCWYWHPLHPPGMRETAITQTK